VESLLNIPQQGAAPLSPVKSAEQAFSALRIKRKHLAEANLIRYRIHLKGGQSLVVEAPTAYEAFREAGTGEIVRIVREAPAKARLLEEHVFSSDSTEFVDTNVLASATAESTEPETIIQSPRHQTIARQQIIIPAPNPSKVAAPKMPAANLEAMKESVLGQEGDVEVLPTGEVVKIEETAGEVDPKIAAALSESLDVPDLSGSENPETKKP